jgi:serine/threonine protein kinase
MSDRFGAYQLVRYLAAGGMADLYLARGPKSDADLVLKRIQPRHADKTRVVKMFIDEGRIAQSLDHPNIVRVVDVGNEAGAWYIAMEYIAGHDLIAIARRGVEAGRFLPRVLAVGVAAQVASGLAYAHSRAAADGTPLSIVHCDISPGNVVVSWRGTAKIVDFGIARATIALRAEDGAAGKYQYMAPEQVRGGAVDARADLFSLGVILYELTLRKRLFRGAPEQVRRKVLEGRIPRPREIDPTYPEALERILAKLLARDPEARFPSAAAVRTELRAYLATQSAGWTKRDLARYMRDLFHAPVGAGAAFGEFSSDDDDELRLEHAMPALADDDADVEADPDEPDESSPFSSAFAATLGGPAGTAEPTVRAPIPSFGADEPAPAHTLEPTVRAELPHLALSMSFAEPTVLTPPPGSMIEAQSKARSDEPTLAMAPKVALPDESIPIEVGPLEAAGRSAVGELRAGARRDRAADHARIEIGGETAVVRMPERPVAGESATAIVRLPDAATPHPTLAAQGDGTTEVRTVRRTPRRISAAAVIGVCALLAAAVLALMLIFSR